MSFRFWQWVLLLSLSVAEGKPEWLHNVGHPLSYMRGLNEAFGYKLLVLLLVAEHLLKGFVNSITQSTFQFLFQSMGVTAVSNQIYQMVIMLPWGMKPLIGYMSDRFPVFGHVKVPYVLFFLVLGLCGLGYAAFVPDYEHTDPKLMTVALVLMSLMLSSVDLFAEATYAARMKTNIAKGPDLMSYVWLGIMAFGLVGVSIAGPMCTAWGDQVPFMVAIPIAAVMFVPTLLGYFEDQVDYDRPNSAAEYPVLRFLCILTFVASLAMMASGLLLTSHPYWNAIVSVVVVGVVVLAFSLTINPHISKLLVYLVISHAVMLNFSGSGGMYFFTLDKKEYPSGPHVSQTFYQTVLMVVQTICQLIGIGLYQQFLKEMNCRKIFIGANSLACVLHFLDVMLYSQTNRAIGIPDRVFILGSTTCQAVVAMISFMPCTVLLAQMCPKRTEGIMFGMLAGVTNLGQNVSRSLSAALLQSLGVTPAKDAGDQTEKFKYLWVASLIASSLMIIPILIVPFFIPNIKQTETMLVGDEADDPTIGAILQLSCFARRSSPPPSRVSEERLSVARRASRKASEVT